MTFRPYPSAARARHQLDRHVHYEEVPLITLRPETARLFRGLVEGLRTVADSGAITRLRPFPAAVSGPGSSR